MPIRQRLSYSNVVASIALFISLGAGAYASGIGRDEVQSRNIADDTIKSRDVRDHTLLGPDIRDETLDFKEIREDRLDVNQFANLVGAQGFCDPVSTTYVDCATVQAVAEQTSDLLVIADGGQFGQGGPSSGRCQISVDGASVSEARPGEVSSTNTNGSATNGFAVTEVANDVSPGRHAVALQCNQTSGDTLMDASISVLVLDAS